MSIDVQYGVGNPIMSNNTAPAPSPSAILINIDALENPAMMSSLFKSSLQVLTIFKRVCLRYTGRPGQEFQKL